MGEVTEVDYWERLAHANEAMWEAERDAPMPGEKPPPDEAEQLADLLKFARDAAAPMWPYLPDVYTDEAIGAIASTGSALMKKYGVTLGGLGARFGEEIAFVMVLGPLALAHWLAHRAWKAKCDAERTIEAGEHGASVTEYREAPAAPQAAPVEDHGGRLRAA
ncbi:hypothetical protein OYT13_11460 [Pandoraea sp. XJJ-1]|uniref:hypothetical protein n=1 Tax=Pandoraea sp. XJJ-1 TaxID=3002643 RepID=UPI00227E1E69|nr:hypothetical protein [Pandoraea sp. XJJ-1]WAL84964.1 hypothetical protein OYT13_11460 [Pandoraea sp. XJJ-1]